MKFVTNKKHVVTRYILFKLNFGRYLWKEDPTVKMKFESILKEIGLKNIWTF